VFGVLDATKSMHAHLSGGDHIMEDIAWEYDVRSIAIDIVNKFLHS